MLTSKFGYSYDDILVYLMVIENDWLLYILWTGVSNEIIKYDRAY